MPLSLRSLPRHFTRLTSLMLLGRHIHVRFTTPRPEVVAVSQPAIVTAAIVGHHRHRRDTMPGQTYHNQQHGSRTKQSTAAT